MENIEFNHLSIGLSLILVITLLIINHKNKQEASTEDIVTIVGGAFALFTCLELLSYGLGWSPFNELRISPIMSVGVFVILNISYNRIKNIFYDKPDSS